MNNTTKELTMEIVPQELGLDKPAKESLETAFAGFFQDAEGWKNKSEIITDPKEARTARLELKSLRVSAEKKRKELKADSLRMGKAIDGANNILLAIIVPIEKNLESIEKAEERRIAQELADLTAARTDEMRKFTDAETPLPNVGAMTDEQFKTVLNDAKLLFDTKAEAVRKAAEEAAKREAEEAAERVRIAEENKKLKKLAAEREITIQKEREVAEKLRAKEAAKVEAVRVEEAAKANAELEKVEAAAKAEREKSAAIAAKEAAEREAVELEIKRMKDAEAKALAAKEQAEDNAKKAPDKDKLTALASDIRAIRNPQLTSKRGVEVTKTISEQIEKFALWVEKEAAKI